MEAAEDDSNKGWEELTMHNINRDDIVVGIAASAPLPTYGCLEEGTEKGILTAICNPHSPVAAEAEIKSSRSSAPNMSRAALG